MLRLPGRLFAFLAFAVPCTVQALTTGPGVHQLSTPTVLVLD